MSILQNLDYIEELLTFDDSNVPYELWEKKNEKLSSDLLKIRIDHDTLILIKHQNYLKSDLYYNVNSVDLTHCNITLILPNPAVNFEKYLKVRSKLIKHVETLLKKAYKAKNLNCQKGA